MKKIWALLIMLVMLAVGVQAACNVDLTVTNYQTSYKPYDKITVTATSGYGSEGTVIFYVINPQDQEVGHSPSTTFNLSGQANAEFTVGSGWMKGVYKIKADYSRGSCSASKIAEVTLDTFTVPVNMDLAANFSLTNISQCQNMTSNTTNITYQICLNGQVPTGFSWNLRTINASALEQNWANISVDPSVQMYPFEFVKTLQDRMTDSIWQNNKLVDSNTRLTNDALNQTVYISNLQSRVKELEDGILQKQIDYWQYTATQCQTNKSSDAVKNQARNEGFAQGAIIFFFVGLILGILILFIFVWAKTRPDDLGGPSRGRLPR